jgi:phosphoribosylformylglycinamidine cyclo-ligase
MSDNYARRGVSAGKEDVHFAIQSLDKGLFPNAFCKVLPDLLSGDEAYCSIMHADGAGTKSALAYLYWKETGDASVWRGIAQDALVMNLDDMLCAGATGPFLFSNTIGRNPFHVDRTVLAEIMQGMEDVFAMLQQHGIYAVNTGGETADVGDVVRTLIFDATAMTRLPRAEIITNERIAPGDVIVGLASYGQASYESQYNSGIGSNGLTNARHDLLHHDYAAKYPESFSPQVPGELVYAGPHRLTDAVPEIGLDVGRLLLSPTRTFLPIMKPLLAEYHEQIHGLIHCTGGGQTKVMKFVRNLHVIKDHLFETPPVFRMIQAASGATWREMYQVFNMGHRLEIYTDEATAEQIITQAKRFHVPAQVIGRCEQSNHQRLTIKGEEELVFE